MRKVLIITAAALLAGCATTGVGTNFTGYSQFQGVSYGNLSTPTDCGATPGLCGRMVDAAQPYTTSGPIMPK